MFRYRERYRTKKALKAELEIRKDYINKLENEIKFEKEYNRVLVRKYDKLLKEKYENMKGGVNNG